MKLIYLSEIIFIIICGTEICFSRRFHHHFNHNIYSQNVKNIKYNLKNESLNKNYHLPHKITPIEYILKILPFFETNDTFAGEATIKILVNRHTNKIVLNSLNLDFNAKSIFIHETGIVDKIVDVTDVKIGNNPEQVIIITKSDLRANKEYDVLIKYTGFLSNNMLGLYKSWYLDENGELKWIISTHMEATHARSVFPCFDEPRFRTPFTMKIARYKYKRTVSIMPQILTTLPDPLIEGRVWDFYKKTPSIPTYLVAFCIFELAATKMGRLTIWVQPNAIDQTYYVLKKLNEILNKTSEYTTVLFNLPKMDLVALPDFNVGGMENWGLMTFRERNILYQPNVSTALDKQLILTNVANGLAYQWFGNLVTPKWWSYLWLNEAFAHYFKYYITSLIEPTWRIMDQFVVRELQLALSEDDSSNHPLNVIVSTPNEIEDIFNIYMHGKGSSILRMIACIVGEVNFKNGIRQYLKKGIHQAEGLVSPTTFIDAFKEKLPGHIFPNGATFPKIMETWIRQNGYPLVTLTRNYENHTVNVTQVEFSDAESILNSTNKWWIPLTLTYEGNEIDINEFKVTWISPNKPLEMKLQTDGWIIGNVRQIGYYRVNYDEVNWYLLKDQLIKNHTIISPVNRAQIIDDSFALAEAGIINYEIPLSISEYLIKERDFIPWYSAIKAFNKIFDKLYGSPTGLLFKAYILHLLRPVYYHITEIPLNNQTHTDKLSVNYIVLFACKIGLTDCERDAVIAFNDWIVNQSPDRLAPEIQEAVLCTAVKLGTEQTWNDIWSYYERSNVSTEKLLVLKALGCCSNPQIINKYLTMLTYTEPPLQIRQHDYKHVFQSIISEPSNTGIALDFIFENYKLYQNKTDIRILKSFVESIGASIMKEQDYFQVKEFYNKTRNQLDQINVTFNKSLIKIQKRLNWITNKTEIIGNYLNSHKNEFKSFESDEIEPFSLINLHQIPSSISPVIREKFLSLSLFIIVIYFILI